MLASLERGYAYPYYLGILVIFVSLLLAVMLHQLPALFLFMGE